MRLAMSEQARQGKQKLCAASAGSQSSRQKVRAQKANWRGTSNDDCTTHAVSAQRSVPTGKASWGGLCDTRILRGKSQGGVRKRVRN